MLKRAERLESVKPQLAAAIKLGCSRLTFDTLVVEGVRTREQMAINYGKGAPPSSARRRASIRSTGVVRAIARSE